MISKLMVILIKLYQKTISKYVLIGANCRFRPTCSNYAIQAYEKYGFFKGTFLSVKRVLKCHPFHPGGEDPLI